LYSLLESGYRQLIFVLSHFPKETRTDAITTCCQRLISAATQPSSILLKSVAIGFHQTLKISKTAYL